MATEQYDVIVIGGGQAGLATGYHLARQGLRSTILEAHDRIGESWRRRWDSLRVFTRARYDSLPGMRFPHAPDGFPTKDEVADYLESYAREMALPVRAGTRVESLEGSGNGGFVVVAGEDRFEAKHVVVASGAFHEPKVPDFAIELRRDITQLHSSQYRRRSQLQPGGVLVVGASNSGAEIAFDAVREHETWLVGRDAGEMPFDINGRVSRLVDPFFWFALNHILTTRTPMGRRARPFAQMHGGPLERVRKRDLAAAGVHRVVGRAVGVSAGLPTLEDGQVLDVHNVIWATGFRHEYPWIHLPVIGEDGWPIHERGVATSVPGIYFVGLPFQFALASSLIGGVGRDARYVVDRIVAAREGPEGVDVPDRVERA
jgi:putative flavoprotein involved in K+ transport